MVCLTTSEMKAINEHRSTIMKYADLYGSVKEGIRVYLDLALMGHDLLNEHSANELAFTFCNFSSEFLADLELPLDPEAFRDSIRNNARGMETEHALMYVMALKEAAEISAPSNIKEYLRQPADLWDPEAFQRKIRDIVAEPGEFSLEDRIEQIISDLKPNLLASPILQAWDDELIEAAWDQDTRETLGYLEEEAYSRGERHAIHIAAFYLEIARGNIPGIPKDVSPEMVALFYSAEKEIHEVYQQLSNNEMELYLAESRLRKILEVVSYRFADLMIIALEGGTIAAVFFTMKALEIATNPALFVTCAFAVLYLGAMKDFNWELICLAGDTARGLERDILTHGAKKAREKAALAEEW